MENEHRGSKGLHIGTYVVEVPFGWEKKIPLDFLKIADGDFSNTESIAPTRGWMDKSNSLLMVRDE